MDQINRELKAEELSEDEKKFLVEKNYPACTTWVHTNPCRLLVPRTYEEMSVKLRQFEFRPQDVVLMSYPKSGTTWMSEILWAMASINELQRAEEEAIMDRIIFLHNDILRPTKEGDDTAAARKFRSKFPGKDFKDGVTFSLASVAPDRRVIRTHILPPLLHPNFRKTTKLVYLLRNPKDTCVSYYHYRKDSSLAPFLGDFPEFCDLFMGNVMPWGVYWNHVREMWSLKGHPNILFVFYEDLKKNLMGELAKINDFFEFHLSEDQLKRVADHSDIKNMRLREAKVPFLTSIKHSFFREGKVGGWASLATPELDRQMDKWIEEGSKGMDIKFTFQ